MPITQFQNGLSGQRYGSFSGRAPAAPDVTDACACLAIDLKYEAVQAIDYKYEAVMAVDQKYEATLAVEVCECLVA